ncbi:tyrosine-protein kinase family protein [Mitsuaria sp. WAJ17]|uniref:XrtA-associated tyrosine autokinase n=1 Tax=Mitsuaria sp. WAJ17 TaxID=2761452 RepID=UPI0016017949|nr:XrtA-associated tyrosine autokinase [Mitsuaria sp. WAJ17]MBB2485638.1 tyrosine-protein kinase family protein [Mitsuaria sp. WAJ17]
MAGSLIEQAAQRLEQLRQAGVDIDQLTPPASPPPMVTDDLASPIPAAPAAAAAGQRAAPVSPVAAPARSPAAPAPAVSKRVELDLEALAAMGLVTPNAPRTPMADQYRVIKRPLIRNATGRGAEMLNHGNLIMVTSALAGEGKSFTSLNLAMSIAAELDHTVMLVDADVARPSVLRMLGLPPGPGLLDVLEESVDLADALLRTSIDKLTVLPSGTPHARATELLASDAMRKLLDDMARRYPDRIIIFDSPPLLLTTESAVLASQMGQIVVVVHAESTPQSAVRRALSTIEACPVRLMLLNQARVDADGSYGYGYGYGYGYEHSESPDASVSLQPAEVAGHEQ